MNRHITYAAQQLNDLLRNLEMAINSTPTSPVREELTIANMLAMKAQEHMKVAVQRAVAEEPPPQAKVTAERRRK